MFAMTQQDIVYGHWILVEEDSMRCPVRGLGDGYTDGADDVGVGRATPTSIVTTIRRYSSYLMPLVVTVVGVAAVNLLHADDLRGDDMVGDIYG